MNTYKMFKNESYLFGFFLFWEHKHKHKMCMKSLPIWVKMKAFI